MIVNCNLGHYFFFTNFFFALGSNEKCFILLFIILGLNNNLFGFLDKFGVQKGSQFFRIIGICKKSKLNP